MPLGYAAYIDILGFQRQLQNEAPLDQVFQDYEEAIKGSTATADGEDHQNKFVVFSDNIVVYNTDDSAKGFADISVACSRLFYNLAQIDFPVRGCISFGRFKERPGSRGSIVYGRPIVEAVEYESRQNWVGIMTGPSIARRWTSEDGSNYQLHTVVNPILKDATGRTNASSAIMLRTGVPFKTESGEQDHLTYGIIPNRCEKFTREETEECIGEMAQKMRELESYAPNPAAQKKYKNTIGFLQKEAQSQARQIS